MLNGNTKQAVDVLMSFAQRNGVLPRKSDLKSLDLINITCDNEYDSYYETLISKVVDRETLLEANKKYTRSKNPLINKQHQNAFEQYVNDAYDIPSADIGSNMCSMPFVDEGVLVVDKKTNPFKAHFKTTDYNKETGKGNLHITLYQKEHNDYSWLCSFLLEDYNFFINPMQALSEAKGNQNPITLGLLAYGVINDKFGDDIPNENKNLIKRGLYKYSSYSQYAEEELVKTALYITDTLCVFSYINKQLEQYKDVEQINAQQDKPAKVDRNKKVIYECQGTVDKRKYLLIGKDVTVTVGDKSHLQTSTVNQKKTIRRLVDVWSVRGHIRHYKSGKEIYIHPYQKGRNRATEKPQPKTYIIANKDNDEINI